MTMLVSSATTVAGRLAETRRLAGLTTRQMANAVGSSQATISNWENGKGEPSVSQFALWARATKQPLDVMIEGLDLCARRDSNPQPSDPEFADQAERARYDDRFWSIVCQAFPDSESTYRAAVA